MHQATHGTEWDVVRDMQEMSTIEEVKKLLGEVLQIGDRAQAFEVDTGLFGAIPELDSMAVATLIAGLEDRFGFMVEDDEISAETFGTVGTLASYVDEKLSA